MVIHPILGILAMGINKSRLYNGLMTIPQELDIQSKSIQPLTMAAMAHMF